MTRTASPLRYPGGKSALLDRMTTLLRSNQLDRRPYAEPFAGGCGLALGLLLNGVVSELHLNDIDPAIWSFWNNVLNHTEKMCDQIEQTEVTVDEWRRQRLVLATVGNAPSYDLGFAAFFLNRTSRSGIIKGAGVIGGLEQNGNYLVDCRFNKPDLIKRIRRIAKYRDRIKIYRLDALAFLDTADFEMPKKSLICVDPPYYNKGSSLYTSFYKPEDHAELAHRIAELTVPWVVTYDNCSEISSLYQNYAQYTFSVNYSVQSKRKTSELLVAAPELRISEESFAIAAE